MGVSLISCKITHQSPKESRSWVLNPQMEPFHTLSQQDLLFSTYIANMQQQMSVQVYCTNTEWKHRNSKSRYEYQKVKANVPNGINLRTRKRCCNDEKASPIYKRFHKENLYICSLHITRNLCHCHSNYRYGRKHQYVIKAENGFNVEAWFSSHS